MWDAIKMGEEAGEWHFWGSFAVHKSGTGSGPKPGGGNQFECPPIGKHLMCQRERRGEHGEESQQ